MKYVNILLFVVLWVIYSGLALGFFAMNYDAYGRGYRYIVLLLELVFIPAFYVGSMVHLIKTAIREKAIGKPVNLLLLKYFGAFILLLLLFFIAGMIFNDHTKPGANINF
jgi:hypothetical protein